METLIPKNLYEALEILNKKNNMIPYSGGTDIMIAPSQDKSYLFINKINELKKIKQDDNNIYIGSGCTFTEILNNENTPDILKNAIKEIAAPAIRNIATIGGNIGNGSPKADSVLILFVTDSKICIQSKSDKRIIPIKKLYKGRKILDLKNNELITEIIIPKKFLKNYYYEKVGARKALSISRISFAGIMNIKNNIIIHCSTAFGAISDIIIKEKKIDNMLINKTIEEAKNIKNNYIKCFKKIINPIKGRVSSTYRKNVCINLLVEFLNKNGI